MKTEDFKQLTIGQLLVLDRGQLLALLSEINDVLQKSEGAELRELLLVYDTVSGTYDSKRKAELLFRTSES